ncbi:MAG: UDP-N-acetylglucosamine 2-epimerase (non-hydrolyzing) [Pirellulales bacterium]|nr:UDP-N-acetylglucosamine 2-epimerase (non-hydrolyzing) [Pirellulales bacterium]
MTAGLACIAGARPNFMKIAPLVKAFTAANLDPYVIHTGQHYDEKMSESFFRDLGIPQPRVNLEVGSGSHVFQIAEVMKRLEAEFAKQPPRAVVVVGDVNSTVAGAITGVKLGIPVAHVEAGLRSGDRSMPEETNRILTDAIADWLFTSEPAANDNLRREGVPEEKIHFVGNVMIDTLLENLRRARQVKAYEQFDVPSRGYAVLTLHRPSNVDQPERLQSILRAITQLHRQVPVLFVMHPRTQAKIREFGFADQPELNGYRWIDPQPYHSMLSLTENARLVLTDSGGLQEETTMLGVPCLTIRDNTERPITIDVGSNRLVSHETGVLATAIRDCLDISDKPWQVPELWDGQAAVRIAEILRRDLN